MLSPMATRVPDAATDVDELARALYSGLVLAMRRVKQVDSTGEMSLAERAVLSRLERTGPTTAAVLARAEHVTPQAMGVTVAALEARGLVERRSDPDDRRRAILTVSATAQADLRHARDARARRVAEVLAGSFSPAELSLLSRAAPLIERLGESM